MTLLPVHCALLACTAALVNHHVPDPYMDEIFHIPQAQRYCSNDFATWDPKLTTPPGLHGIKEWKEREHILNFVIDYYRYLISRLFSLCNTTVNLRIINLVFAICLYPVIRRLVQLHHPQTHRWTQHAFTLALVWFPVGFFYNFVYYTDPGSTLFVLLCYLLAKENRYTLAGLSGLISLTFRQTNVIWVCVTMVISMMDVISFQDQPLVSLWSQQQPSIALLNVIRQLIVQTLQQYPLWIKKLYMFLLTIMGFAAFLVWNNGIVLGDRSNHIAGLHFPQLFYFSSFLSFFAAPWLLTSENVRSFFSRPSWKGIFTSLILAANMYYLIDHYTYEHPFLLSDNRHYTFYVWKKIYRRHWSIRYLLIPFYIISGWFNLRPLVHHTGFLVCLGYLLALVLTLVPSPLLEFRYFIIPFLFYCIQLGPPQRIERTWMVVFTYTLIHIITIYLYLYKPFEWIHEPGPLQRFMW
ncbi:alpha-2-glucosyltransferase Alg10 [Phascolomyces articulosus]|uniref:Dol-P-Glc:Glc(2)Man(9)GlcNAc(2)-PP-Dol alpha-1,2-glucosyltransferase n=1 Tax=Phascolomyces articulosus TaxID=60185 RepID=A0AAD5JZG2_9FUNG|nr:alpha-2-glucosyltransferase Alg10 [Phascolomyces articulosus]